MLYFSIYISKLDINGSDVVAIVSLIAHVVFRLKYLENILYLCPTLFFLLMIEEQLIIENTLPSLLL
jgi:hypothetical protein